MFLNSNFWPEFWFLERGVIKIQLYGIRQLCSHKYILLCKNLFTENDIFLNFRLATLIENQLINVNSSLIIFAAKHHSDLMRVFSVYKLTDYLEWFSSSTIFEPSKNALQHLKPVFEIELGLYKPLLAYEKFFCYIVLKFGIEFDLVWMGLC